MADSIAAVLQKIQSAFSKHFFEVVYQMINDYTINYHIQFLFV